MNHKLQPQVSTRLLLALVAIALLVVPTMMFGQTERTASIQGTVKDPSGAVVSGATVELASPALFTGKTTYTTDSSGYYRFDNLRPGMYEMTITKTGFSTHKQTGIDLAVGRMPTIDVSLKVGATSETVEVTGAAPQIDVATAKVQTNVTSEMLADIPKGRSFQSVIQFAPGARAEPLQGGPNNGVLGYQIDGATNAENSYMVEGQETADIQFGNAATQVPMEFTQEVVIKSSGFEAEHGTASIGGIVNAIQKRGSNSWHGSIFTYYQGDTLDAQPNRGLRDRSIGGIPTAEYIQPKKDHYRIWEPGFEVGGYLLKDKLWVFASSVPQLLRQERTVFMTAINNPRTFPFQRDTYYSLGRLDAMPWQKLHVYGSWQYNYQKAKGSSFPAADDVFGAPNLGGGSSNPDNYNAGIGYVRPSMILGAGGDVTITPNLIFSSRWGRQYYDYQDRGLPIGIRYFYRDSTYPYGTSLAPANTGTPPGSGIVGLDGTTLNVTCPACVQASGFASIGLNVATLFDQYWRSNWAADMSWFHKGWGTHNIKFGYLFGQVANNVLIGYNTAQIYVAYDRDWSPTVSPGAGCTAIVAFNEATWPADPRSSTCRGNYGTVNIRDGVENTGLVKSRTHGLYVQDAWNVGHGLTLNLGIRFDHENLPSYAPGLPSINFGWGSKIAPRLGASWDVMNNGKLKLYGSFGYFYDIMKYDLPRGSFGGDYWHDCVYALDDPNVFTGFIPARDATGKFCPATGGAGGVVTGGRFIANEDFRIPSNDPLAACDTAGTPGSCVAALKALKPTKQHEIVLGADWAITPRLAFTARWSRKRLDRTIEDAGLISDAGEGYAIVNPGFGIHAVTCSTCPPNPKAIRRYDGIEFGLTKAASAHWFGQVSYTYSRLRGNYSGLTATDISDGGGGRQGGDVSRAFDEPFGSFDAHGVPIDGPLATDRPHAVKAMAYYRMKWWKMETTVGGFQQWYSGSPMSTYMSVWGMPVFVEGRGNFVDVTAAPGLRQDWTLGSIEEGKRTPRFSQTDLSIVQEMHVSKQNERLKLGVELNFTNIFNQHSPTFINQNLMRSGSIHPSLDTATSPCGSVGIYYDQLLTGGYNYIDEANANPASDNCHATLQPMYGLPYGWQNPRSIRFKVKFTF
jgi:outer membrane receptor protein involved in Fe transport